MVALLALFAAAASAPASAQCVGDCDQNGAVVVNELITGVNIALRRAAVDACTSLDTDGNGLVAINELIGAVNNALRGCGFAGRYTAAVALDDGAVGTLDLLAAADGSVRGTVAIAAAATRPALQIGTTANVSGSFDPATGAFEVSGSFRGAGGETVTVRLSGTLGASFSLEIGDRSWSANFGGATPTPTATATPAGTRHRIKVGDPVLPFDPEVLEIDPGDTVVWEFVQGAHSVRAATLNAIGQPSCTASGLFDSGMRSPGAEFAYTFTTPGRYGFHCGVAGHCDNFEYGYIDVRGTPSPTSTRVPTATPTSAISTATPTPDTIDGVSTRLLGVFSGVATVGTQSLAARLQIQVDAGVVTVIDLSQFPYISPNPLQMAVLSPTSLSYQSAGPPPVSFTLMLNDVDHVVGSYTVTDPIMPHLPIAFDLTKES